MLGSTLVYTGLVVMTAGLLLAVKPIDRIGMGNGQHALALAGVGVLIVGSGFLVPVSESRTPRIESRLDEFVPIWQFSEHHDIRIAAPPEQVYRALKSVRADEITLFNTLTWIRRGGRQSPQGILNAGNQQPLIDVATQHGFIRLADSTPTELVIGTIVLAPPGARRTLAAETFKGALPPGFAVAAMNFLVKPDGVGGSLVSTETRVFANTPAAERKFARYWRLIFPGSALIRRMWLHAVRRRAMNPGAG
ncbi:MAG: hypothetical protein ABR611_15585 [Chthoniobacterales bacterium]